MTEALICYRVTESLSVLSFFIRRVTSKNFFILLTEYFYRVIKYCQNSLST
jgi:hypothetical protein